MGQIKGTIVLFILLLNSSLTYSQSTDNAKMSQALKKEMLKQGYKLIEEGGVMIRNEQFLLTDKRYYRKDEELKFIAVVDNCSYCSLSIKFGSPGEIPASLPNKKTKIKRVPNSKLTLISFHGKASNTGQGYFMLFNNSKIKRYAYAMLFKKR